MLTIKAPHCGRTHYIIIGARACFKDYNQRMHTTGKHRLLRKTGEDIARKRGSEIWKGRFWPAKAKVWQHESKGLALRNINKSHPRRSLRASAPVVTSIRVGRYEHPRRSVRASASVGADVCVGRCRCLRRSIRASASVDADDKSREYEEEKRWGERGKRRAWSGRKRGINGKKEGYKRGEEGCVGGVSKLPYSKKITKPWLSQARALLCLKVVVPLDHRKI